MDETMMNSTEELDQNTSSTENTTNDALQAAIEEQLVKIRRQNLLLGSQVVCHTVLDKITTAMNKPGKRSMNDYKRLVKDIAQFCQTGLSRRIDENGEAQIVAESTDNSTKLMEDSNEL